MSSKSFLKIAKNENYKIESTTFSSNTEKQKKEKIDKALKVKMYDDGLWRVTFDEPNNRFIQLEQLSSAISISAIAKTESSDNWSALLQWLDNAKNIHTWAMPMEIIHQSGNMWLEKLTKEGFWVLPDGISHIKNFLASSYKNTTKQARLAIKTGWSEDLKTFALPHTNIGSDQEELVVMQQTPGTSKMYKSSGTLEDWKQEVAEKSVGNSRLTFMACAAFTGPILYMTGAENGGFHFVGESSKGKSTALRLAASIWGDQAGHFKSWRTTDNAAESLAVFSNDTCLILDEIGEAPAKAAAEMAYMLSNGIGKARAGRDGQARAVSTWRTTFLSSGEITLGQKLSEAGIKPRAGQEVRVAEILADAGKNQGIFEDCKGMQPNDFAVSIKEAAQEFYGTAGAAFVEVLIKTEDISKKIKKLSDDFAKSACEKEADGQVLRVAQRFGLCLAAGKIAVEHGILPHTIEDIEISVKKCFESWLEMRGGQGAGEDREIIKTLKLFIELHGQSRFQNLHPRTDQDGQEIEQICHNRCGFRDGDKFYILEEAWEKEIFKGFNTKKAAKILRKEEILRCKEYDHYKTKKALPGLGKVPCYIIKMDTSDIRLETSEQTKTIETQANLLEGTDKKIEGIPPEDFFGEILNGMQ